MLGHGAVEDSLRTGLAGLDVDARFATLGPLRGWAKLAVRSVPLLEELDLDLQRLRWHAAQAVRARRTLLRELARDTPDVVHVHSHSIALGFADAMAKHPFLLSLDATIEIWESMGTWRPMRRHSRARLRPSLLLERRILGRAATVLAWTEWARREVERACPSARVVVHSPGIDLVRFRPSERRPRQARRVLFVGGRFVQKGGLDLLAALEPSLGADVELDVVTPAGVAERPGVRVHRLGRGDPRLIDLFQQADVFCLPTHADTFGLVLTEAMACGTPVVSTAVGGIPEVLDGGRAGILVEPRDRSALRSALGRLLADEALRAELAARGRARCEERYDARRQAVRLLELMRAAASR